MYVKAKLEYYLIQFVEHSLNQILLKRRLSNLEKIYFKLRNNQFTYDERNNYMKFEIENTINFLGSKNDQEEIA